MSIECLSYKKERKIRFDKYPHGSFAQSNRNLRTLVKKENLKPQHTARKFNFNNWTFTHSNVESERSEANIIY